MIKLIASDIDGTLVEEGSGELPGELFAIIEKLYDHGILFAAASGRQYRGLRKLFLPVADKIIFISENGSNVVYRNEELYASVIDKKIVKEMQTYVKRFPNCYLTMSTTGAMHSTGGYDENYRRLMVESYHNDMVFAEDEDSDLLKVIKISVYHEEGIREFAEEMTYKWQDRLNVAVAGIPWIDFMNPGTDKGTALKFLQQYFGITPQETLAFGDNHNDIGMIQAAGESCAVETARTAVKDAAKYIVGSYRDKGVILALEELLGRLEAEKRKKENNMAEYGKECIQVFLDNQLQLFDEKVAETPEEAEEFLEDNMAVVLDNIGEVRQYLDESGMDACELSEDELKAAAEVFELPEGKYLVVLA